MGLFWWLKFIVLCIWQLPQTIIAGIVFIILRLKGLRTKVVVPHLVGNMEETDGIIYIEVGGAFKICLGTFLFYDEKYDMLSVAHSYGHCIQSQRLRPVLFVSHGYNYTC